MARRGRRRSDFSHSGGRGCRRRLPLNRRGGNSQRRGLGGSFTLSDDGGDHRADGAILAAIGNDDLPAMAFIGGLKLHRRLVGLDLVKEFKSEGVRLWKGCVREFGYRWSR